MIGSVLSVTTSFAGVETADAVPAGGSVLPVVTALDLPETGGVLDLDGTALAYSRADHDAATVTLAAPLTVEVPRGAWLPVSPPAPEVAAQVLISDDEHHGSTVVEAVVPTGVDLSLPEGVRGEGEGESVALAFVDGVLSIVDILDHESTVDARFIPNAEELLLANRQMLGEKLAENDLAIASAQTDLDAAEAQIADAFGEIDLKADSAYVDAAKQQAIDAAAIDAQAKADEAESDAIAAAQSALTQAETDLQAAIASGDAAAIADAEAKIATAKSEAIAAAADDATEKADQAREDAKAFATTTANGLAKTFWSTALPGTTKAPQNSTWYRHSGGKIISVFTQTAAGSQGSTWSARPITSEAIDNLDVGKLTAASGTINSLVVNEFAVKLANIIEANVGNLTVTGDTHLESLVAETIAGDTASFMELTVDQILAGFVQAEWIITQDGAIIAGDPLGRAVEVDRDGIIIYDVGAEGERFVSSSLGGLGADALLLTNEFGATLAGFTPEGLLVAQGGAFAQDVSVAGQPLVGKLLGTDNDEQDGILDRLPRGILDGGIRRVVGTTGPKTGEVRSIYISVALEPGRLYRCVALWDGMISNYTGGVRVRMRHNFTGAYPSLGNAVIGTESVVMGYSPTVPVSVRAEGVLSVDTATDFGLMLTYQGRAGSTAARRDMTLYIEDIGPGTLTVESNSSDTGATRKTYTSTWRASDSATFDGNGNPRSASGDIVSGYYSGYGSQRGVAVFESSATSGESSKTIAQALSGATLVKAEIRFYANHTWNSSGGTVTLGELGKAYLPSSLTSGQAGSTSYGGSIAAGQSKWFSVPVEWFEYNNRGVVVGSGVTTDMEYYVRLNGHTDSPSTTRPHLRLTYTR